MIRKSSVLILAVLAFACQSPEKKRTTYRIPAEWEPQERIWLGFATLERNEMDSGRLDILRAINSTEKVRLVVETDSLRDAGKAFLAGASIDTSTIDFFVQAPTDFWYRDPGPIFAWSPELKLSIADFKYTEYANVPPDSISKKAKAHERIDRDVANRLKLETVSSIIAHEGGSFETNGKGAVILTESITQKRNPHLSAQQIENDLQEKFGIETVIWLENGLAEDPPNLRHFGGGLYGFGTGGHTDEMVRFANDTTILLAWAGEASSASENEIEKTNIERLTKALERLSSITDHMGRKFTVIKVPVPDLFYRSYTIDSEDELKWYQRANPNVKMRDVVRRVASASYLNFITTNHVIILPKYWKEGMNEGLRIKDEEVRKLFEKLYPDRTIAQVDAINLNYRGGGMHCTYQPEPRLN